MSLRQTRRFDLLGGLAERLQRAQSGAAVLEATARAGDLGVEADAVAVFLRADDPAVEEGNVSPAGPHTDGGAANANASADPEAADGTASPVGAVEPVTIDTDGETVDLQLCVTGGDWPADVTEEVSMAEALVDVSDGDSRGATVSARLDDVTTSSSATPVQSAVAAPVGDRGVIVYLSADEDAFDDVDREFVTRVGSLVAAALDRTDRERELRRENERLSTFASAVSHDLKNPLSVASGYLDLTLNRGATDGADATGVGSETTRNLRAVADAVGRATGIVDDLLVLARTPSVDTDEAVPLADVVADAWSDIDAPADRLTVTTNDQSVVCEPGLLRQLLVNLLSNAVEHGDPGCDIRVKPLSDGQGFAVENDGEPVPTETRSAVFEPGRTGDRNGTGLGLAVVDQVAEAHGWDVVATETSDGDARFEVTGVETV
jgi:signal transduction histidine kinase